MKKSKSKILFAAILAVLVLLLTACQVNFKTDLKGDGSGVYTQEIGFQGDEASMSGLSDGSEDFCASQNEGLPPGTTIRQETRNEDETWCIYETAFELLDDLKAIYGTTDTLVNDISSSDGFMTYDITLDLGSDSSSAPMGADIYWFVSMPGTVTDHNADEVDGTTLKWTLKAGETNDIWAVSEISQPGISVGNVNWYVIGGAAVCLCLIVVVIIAGVVIFLLVRRKKNADKAGTPTDTPTA